MNIVKDINIRGLKKLNSGKVREIFEFEEDKLLIVTTDRISAYDVVMNEGIRNKGSILTDIANFWFDKFGDLIENHIISKNPIQDYKSLEEYSELLAGRSIVVRKCNPLPVEAIVRGYLAGSGWKEYSQTGTICGLKMPEGLSNSSMLEEPIFTPSTKAEIGEHDQNISFQDMSDKIGEELAKRVKDISIMLYKEARKFAKTKGIIIADTKFEFGLYNNRLILIDEVLTPDSSRFWSCSKYEEGRNQDSFDKQYLRDYLEGLCNKNLWNKEAPAPALPQDVLETTSLKYSKVKELLLS